MKSNRTKISISATLAVLSLLLVIGAVSRQTAQAQDRSYPQSQDRNYPDRQDNNDRYRNRRGRNWDNYGNYGGSFDLRQTALNAGYNEGMKDGASARQNNGNIDYSNQSAYRKATKDYSSRLGDRELYRRYFREAYQTGFNDGLGNSYDNNRNRDWNRNDNRDWSRDNNPDWNRNNDNRDWNRNNRRGRNWDRYDTYGGSFELRQTALNAGYNEGIKQGRNDRNRNRPSDFRNNNAYQKATTDYSSKLGDRGLYQRYYREGYENGYNDGWNGY
jgi:hypothetical protein